MYNIRFSLWEGFVISFDYKSLTVLNRVIGIVMGYIVGGQHIAKNLIIKSINKHFGFTAKKDQVKALYLFLRLYKDMILVAKTGFGKSIIY